MPTTPATAPPITPPGFQNQADAAAPNAVGTKKAQKKLPPGPPRRSQTTPSNIIAAKA